MRARGNRIQPPGVTQRMHNASAARGSFGIDTHSHRSDFCESVVFTIVLQLHENLADRITGSSYSISEVFVHL